METKMKSKKTSRAMPSSRDQSPKPRGAMPKLAKAGMAAKKGLKREIASEFKSASKKRS